jgi:universal stress protein A
MTTSYQHMLLCLDLLDTTCCRQLLNKSLALQKSHNCQLSLVHVIEPLILTTGEEINVSFTSLEEQIEQHQKEQLYTLADEFEIPQANAHLSTGSISAEVHQLAKQLHADLLIVGTHGRHGLAVLFGSTSTHVLRGTNCDVLAIRINDEDS